MKTAIWRARPPVVVRRRYVSTAVILLIGTVVSTSSYAMDDAEPRCRAEVLQASGKNFYFVCVDALPEQKGIVTLSCSKPDGNSCVRIGELVEPARRFIVAVFRKENLQEQVALSGDPGNVAHIREPPTGQRSQKVTSPVTWQLWYFDPRKSGTLDLTVKVVDTRQGAAPAEIDFSWKYTVQKYYVAAIRLGIGVTWSPWDRTVGVQTTANGQRYASVIEGEGSGIVSSELVAGLSWFPWKVRDGSFDPTLALGIRFGLIQLGSGKWFRSAMVGPEFALGPDLSVGLFGGLAFTNLPNTGYTPGTVLPSNVTSIPTHLGVTPAFGLALNFTPGFLKLAGFVP